MTKPSRGVAACLALVTLFALAAFTTPASATHLVTQQLRWAQINTTAITAPDSLTTLLEDEADSTFTEPIYTTHWSWNRGSGVPGAATAVCGIARITFIASATTTATDSIYYQVQVGHGTTWSLLNPQLPAAAVGNVAVEADGLTQATSTGGKVFVGYLIADPDAGLTNSNNNIWMTPQFRLKVYGDQSGTSPKLPGLQIFISYLVDE